MHLLCPGLFYAPSSVYFHVMCKGNPHKLAFYFLQMAFARLESTGSLTVKSRATSQTVKSRAISPTPLSNLTPILCWETSSSMIGTKQPRTYERKQRLHYATALAKKYVS